MRLSYRKTRNGSIVFCKAIDAAAVYANTSTAFTDGAEFGLGAEIGISTQKLHARGPMALEALTTYKWIIEGNGQIRPDQNNHQTQINMNPDIEKIKKFLR